MGHQIGVEKNKRNSLIGSTYCSYISLCSGVPQSEDIFFISGKGSAVESILKLWTGYLAGGVEGIAGIIVAVAALRAAMQVIRLFVSGTISTRQTHEPQTENIRLQLGRWLALALEFELGADILRTAIAPSWTEIGQLAAIATIRTLLNYFLQMEIDRAVLRQSTQTASSIPPSPFVQTPEKRKNHVFHRPF